MEYTYDLNEGGCLIIKMNEQERKELRELKEERENGGVTAYESEALEELLANSELEWIAPEEIGALTDAPILGIRNCDDYNEIIGAWGFMDYQVRSFVDDLIETGQAVFIS